MNDLPKLKPLDRRLNVITDRVADSRLKGQVDADQFLEGTPATITLPVVDQRTSPDSNSGLETQPLFGHHVVCFDEEDGWKLVQCQESRHVGWVASEAISTSVVQPTHRVCVPRTYIYSEPDLKKNTISQISLGSHVAIVGETETRGTIYALMEDGSAIISRHLKVISEHFSDYVTVAESLINTPYLWGGTSGMGIDCSGLVFLSLMMAGKMSYRDSDLQAATLGEIIDPQSGQSLQRGDLVFWKGHVAIMTDPQTIIHANGHTMTVAIEPLKEAIDRIAYLYDHPIGYRRP